MTATSCLRCGKVCRTGTPDHKARAIVVATESGYCADCMITRFILGIEQMRNLIEGTPDRGSKAAGVIVKGRAGLGPDILLHAHIQKAWAPLLAFTQLPLTAISWERVVENWRLPWPKNDLPKLL